MSSDSFSGTTGPGTPPPRFFVDRSLGVSVTARLRATGWDLVDLRDVYPNDGQDIPDADWITYGCARGWPMLAKDRKIRYSPDYELLTRPLFALRDGSLTLDEMVRRFERGRERIWASCGAAHREFWIVYADRVERRDP